jgi:hypothetical protein
MPIFRLDAEPYSLARGTGVLLVFFAYVAGTRGGPALVQISGWLERLSIVIGMIWTAALAVRLRSEGRSSHVARTLAERGVVHGDELYPLPRPARDIR